MSPQLSRKEEIQKGCGGDMLNFTTDEYNWRCNPKRLCQQCQARLDERIRAEQDFLKMIDELTIKPKDSSITRFTPYIYVEELKSTIQKEKKC